MKIFASELAHCWNIDVVNGNTSPVVGWLVNLWLKLKFNIRKYKFRKISALDAARRTVHSVILSYLLYECGLRSTTSIYRAAALQCSIGPQVRSHLLDEDATFDARVAFVKA